MDLPYKVDVSPSPNVASGQQWSSITEDVAIVLVFPLCPVVVVNVGVN